jgi:hypothetical protein
MQARARRTASKHCRSAFRRCPTTQGVSSTYCTPRHPDSVERRKVGKFLGRCPTCRLGSRLKRPTVRRSTLRQYPDVSLFGFAPCVPGQCRKYFRHCFDTAWPTPALTFTRREPELACRRLWALQLAAWAVALLWGRAAGRYAYGPPTPHAVPGPRAAAPANGPTPRTGYRTGQRPRAAGPSGSAWPIPGYSRRKSNLVGTA